VLYLTERSENKVIKSTIIYLMTTEQRNTYNRVDLQEPLYPERKSSLIDLAVFIGVTATITLLLVIGLITESGIGGLGLALIGFVVLLSAGAGRSKTETQ
jgi:hypothetical protein